MELIDRNKVLKTIPSEEMVARMAVMSAPVVDAIPIEWIKRYANSPFKFIYNQIMYDWQKEQEEQNGSD